MNQKTIIAILGVVVIILIGTTVYFATINKSVAPSPKFVQQPVSTTAPAVQQPTQSATSTIQPNVIVPTDWKTYQDQTYGFQFSYPKAWGSVDVDNSDPTSTYSVGVFNGSDSVQVIKVAYGVNGDGSIQNRESYLKDFASGKYEMIAVAGGVGYYFVEETLGGPSPAVYLVGDKEIFLMSYSIFDIKKMPKLEAEKLIKQIIGTFKFTN